MKKYERKDKNEKRRLAFEKRNAKKEHNLARYGAEGGSALVMAKTTDFNRRFVAAILALVFAISCLVVGVNFATKADDTSAPLHSLIPEEKGEKDPNSGMVLNKYLTPNYDNDGNCNYDLTLEAYATAEVKPITEKIPTDFVVVVDQSGSMDTKDMPTGDPTVQNNKYLEDIANGAYYYKDGDNYYRVYGVKDYLYRYYPANYCFTGDIVEHLGADIGWFMGETDATTNIDNAFYFREETGGQTYYIPIKTTIEGKIGTYYMRFSYPSKKTGGTYEFNREVTTYSSNGNSPWYKNVLNGGVMTSGALWAAANAAVQTLYPNDNAYTYSTINLGLAKPRTGMYINYPMYGRHLSYTKLCYRDVNGVEYEVPSNSNGRTTWEYCDDNGIARTTDSVTSARPTYSGLFTFSGTTDRITALKAALNEFAEAVANETDDLGAVDNRISIVGFSSPNYSNTELLTHTERDISSGSTNGWQKGTCDGNASEYYGKALVGSTDGNVGTVNPKIINAITAITANGGTQPEDGLNMAYQVLTNRSNTTYTIRSGEHKDDVVDRNTAVIFFTDGQPGDYHYSDQYSEANEVIAQAKQIKDYGKTLDYGTNIFSIGVFGESDANPLTYTHETRTNSQGENKAWKYLGGWMESYHDQYYPYSWYCLRRQWRPISASASDNYTATPNDTIFDYMSAVSSNYPDAEKFIDPTWLSGNYTGANGYTGATDGVRHKETAQTTNKYYRMASSQDTLIAAFLQTVTMNNEQSDPDPIPASSIELIDSISDYFSIKLDSDNNPTIKYYTQQGLMGTDGFGDFSEKDPVEIDNPGGGFNQKTKTLTVTGFDFSGEYIARDKTGSNAGRKLIIVIKDVTPNSNVTTQIDSNQNAIRLYSNKAGAGINAFDDSLGKFPEPYISRHSYTMNVTGDDATAAVFNVVPTLTGGTDITDDVILVKPTGERVKYSEYIANGGPTAFTMSNGQTFYFENVPSDYQVNTSITSTDGDHTYTWTDNSNKTLDQTNAESKPYDYENSDIYITSVANTRNATLDLTTNGEFANKEREFPIRMKIVKSDGTNFEGDIQLENGLSLSFTDGSLTNPDSLKLKDGDSVKFTNLPANSTVTITPSNDPGNVYTWTAQLDSGEATSTAKEGAIDRDGHAFHVVYTRGTVTETGVADDDSNSFIYILAGIGVLTVGAGAAYVYRKKDEFVER
ncbi:MAG: hypothetical protein J6K05_09455 [Bacteroidaceae bacterium]|nr:hypothetical protein [Bacteroidaceae bacterium]